MRRRIFRAATVVSFAGMVVAACGDVTTNVFLQPQDGGPTTTPDATPPGNVIDATPPADDGAVTIDAAIDSGVDAPADVVVDAPLDSGDANDGAPTDIDLVFGSTVFAPGNPGQNANAVAEHPAGELPLQGKNCFKAGGCHSENNHKWGFAGTVYSNANGLTTLKNAEVRLTTSTGTPIATVYSDDDGNFWFDGAKPPAGARVGVRIATSKMAMSGTVAGDPGGQCNSGACHGQTNMRIYTP